MLWRFTVFALIHLLLALLGWWLGGLAGVLGGVIAASVGWFLIDLFRGTRVLIWLRDGSAADAPRMHGLWGEVSDRARRAFRLREQGVRDADARLQEFLAAIQASPIGVVLLDEEGRIEWCNAIGALQFGFETDRDLGQHIGNLVRDPAFTAYFTGGEFDHDITMPGRQSTAKMPVRLSVHLHPYGQGRKLLLSRDVTALEQAEVMRRDFVANVSHEIRTPLTVLAGFVETLRDLPLSGEERARYLELMDRQTQRMQTLVNDLLTLSRLEGSPSPGMTNWLTVTELMHNCEQEGSALSRLLYPPDGQAISFEVLCNCEIAGVRNELISALSNLVSNAVRYTPAGGRIVVTWSAAAGGQAVFSVTDSGPGIAPEHHARLTERFYRVDSSRSRETGGTGLGLAIVKHVAQRHGAQLEIESSPGRGSRFSIVFPASRVRCGAPQGATQAGQLPKVETTSTAFS
ncbi:MAG: phosphate regulon sensor histidine kinase PhoR [Burkholderiaceae bacterium]|nr:phosphate regulon sensor histidine kinase PhoR [Burkholderiaceae bacterium]